MPWGTGRSFSLHGGCSKGLGSEQSCGALSPFLPALCHTNDNTCPARRCLLLPNIHNPRPCFAKGEAGRTIRPLLLTSCPLTFNHAHPKTNPNNLGFFQACSQPTFVDIKRWRIKTAGLGSMPQSLITHGSNPKCLCPSLKLPGSGSRCLACAPCSKRD